MALAVQNFFLLRPLEHAVALFLNSLALQVPSLGGTVQEPMLHCPEHPAVPLGRRPTADVPKLTVLTVVHP